MYIHVVFWKIKENKNTTEKEKMISSILNEIHSLKNQISCIADIQSGRNIGDYKASFFDLCFITKFIDKEAFTKYTKHKNHDLFIEYVSNILEDEQIVDFEM